MTRAEAYELAKSRGFDKSVAVFGAKFTSDPDVVICGIKRSGRGIYIDVLSSAGETSEKEKVALETTQDDGVAQERESAKTLPEEVSIEVVAPRQTEKKTIDSKEKPEEKPEKQAGEKAGYSEKKSKHRQESQEGEKEEESVKKEKLRRKIYTANGTHQAICRFQGILTPKGEGDKGFKLLLPNLEIDAMFAFPKTAWYYRKNPEAFEGVRNYIGYPRLTAEGKLVKIYIVSVDSTQNFQKEQWEFLGMWCGPQKSLFVQRRSDMFPDEARPHYYKYRFKNQDEYKKYLWDRYAYQIIAKREGDELLIVRNNPFACPRKKPEPPTRGKPPGHGFKQGQGSGKPPLLKKPVNPNPIN